MVPRKTNFDGYLEMSFALDPETSGSANTDMGPMTDLMQLSFVQGQDMVAASFFYGLLHRRP